MENNANNISDDISVSENNNIASEISDQTEANSSPSALLVYYKR